MTATASATTFNGTYTFENVETGDHRTLKIRTQKPDAKFAPNERIAMLMTGPDNEQSFQGFGFVKDDNEVIVWRKKRGQNGSKSAYEYYAALIQKAALALEVGTDAEEVEATFSFCDRTYRVTLSKRCLACNRKLTNPESLKRGFGPECAQRLGLA